MRQTQPGDGASRQGKSMLSARVERQLLLRFRATVAMRGLTAEEALTTAVENYLSMETLVPQRVPKQITLKPGRRNRDYGLAGIDDPVVILGLDHMEDQEINSDEELVPVA